MAWRQSPGEYSQRSVKNTHTCSAAKTDYPFLKKTQTTDSVVALPIAGLLDILKAEQIRSLPPFSITLFDEELQVELLTEDLAGPKTTVAAGSLYEVDLTAVVHSDGLAGYTPVYRANNIPDWLTIDAITGKVNGTAPLIPGITKNIGFAVIVNIYEASLPNFDLTVVDDSAELTIGGIPRITSRKFTTYQFQPPTQTTTASRSPSPKTPSTQASPSTSRHDSSQEPPTTTSKTSSSPSKQSTRPCKTQPHAASSPPSATNSPPTSATSTPAHTSRAQRGTRETR